MIDSGVRLLARLHCLKPIHQMLRISVIRSRRVRRRSSGNLHDFFMIASPSGSRDLIVDRAGISWIILLPAPFAGGYKKRRTLSAVVCDSSIASLNTRKAAIAVSKYRLVCIEKTLRVRDCRDTGIRVFTPIFPGEDCSTRNLRSGPLLRSESANGRRAT
jgi:hypothetical protein